MSDGTRGLTDDERALMQHVIRWGSDGYPVQKLSQGRVWGPWRSVKGPPTVFKTKREAYGEERQAQAHKEARERLAYLKRSAEARSD